MKKLNEIKSEVTEKEVLEFEKSVARALENKQSAIVLTNPRKILQDKIIKAGYKVINYVPNTFTISLE